MIHVVVGKLGAGKGLVMMKRIIEEIVYGERDIVTNIPLRVGPWVNGSGVPQLGLAGYLQREHGESFDIEHRIKVVEDMEEMQTMFLWRRNPESGEWFKLPITKVEGTLPARFDAEPVKVFGCKPVLCVSDEAWEYYPAKQYKAGGGLAVPPVIDFYGRQQRKLRDEWYVVTQHHDDLHVMFARITQDFTVCRNHGMERLGIFRQPKIFRTQTYLQQPKKGATVFHESMFRLDAAGLAQCYDTSAGVGVAGGFAADRDEKKKGLHPAWMGVGILALVVLIAYVPHALGVGASKWIGSMSTGSAPAKWSGVSNSVPVVPVNHGVVSNRLSRAGLEYSPGDIPGGSPAPDPVMMTGYAYSPSSRSVLITLSDGRTYRTGDGHVQFLTDQKAVIDGEVFRMVTASDLVGVRSAGAMLRR